MDTVADLGAGMVTMIIKIGMVKILSPNFESLPLSRHGEGREKSNPRLSIFNRYYPFVNSSSLQSTSP